ncbi:type II secretion system ATPase GspE [Methylococcus geothermalis]|uniref:Type II secretion system protein E n=1 Tax=Methylococcus geothermalis TaxID=2681310 RepID=A0A858QAG6_9GAMM|nr:type II secretion system ATPase GspE [Methylococcus geothermalis]QJD30704.1 type II secretion system protein GspE [Methylococcus geothermalis]
MTEAVLRKTEAAPAASVDWAQDGDGYAMFAAALLRRGKVREMDLARARRLSAQADDMRLPALLVKLGVVSERDVAETLAEASGLPLVGPADYPDVSPLPEGVAARFLKDRHAVGVAAREDGFVVAVEDPFDAELIHALGLAFGQPVHPVVGLASEIDRALEQQIGSGRSVMGQIVENLGGDEDADEADVEHLKDLASEAPVIRMVNLIMQRAVESRASDIHVEPFEQQLKVRFRIDGVLRDVEAPPVRSTAAVISRIKIMAKLNIAERRLPQDGRIKLQVQGKELDLRVSTVPTMYGESVVIRLLHKESITFDFGTLGFEGAVLRRFLEILELPHGIILITGPTGSGKSTTLYTALHKINTPSRKIITVEDPVEYQLEGVNQIQVKPQIGLSFASALRSIMRQDPDVIMIGEMRDLETARIAVQSALTGHMVLSTLHTNDAAGGVTRLMDMGLEDYLITSTVNGILGQRLVRRLCQHCREPYPALEEVAEEMGLRRFQRDGEVVLYRPVGCEHCGGTGFRGRLAILEFLVMSDEVRRLVMSHAQARQIEEVALREGMHTMYEDGIRKALMGLTTVEEVLRVTSDS